MMSRCGRSRFLTKHTKLVEPDEHIRSKMQDIVDFARKRGVDMTDVMQIAKDCVYLHMDPEEREADDASLLARDLEIPVATVLEDGAGDGSEDTPENNDPREDKDDPEDDDTPEDADPPEDEDPPESVGGTRAAEAEGVWGCRNIDRGSRRPRNIGGGLQRQRNVGRGGTRKHRKRGLKTQEHRG